MNTFTKALDELDRLVNGNGSNGHVSGGLRPGMDPNDPNLFSEEPVPLDVFCSDKLYLGLPPLSDEQFRLIALGEAVYFDDTFKDLDWAYTREDWWNPSYTEIVAEWGKGSGKDFCCRVICARVAYLLCCLTDPFAYYNLAEGGFDILNVARSTKQANDVFFEPFKRMVVGSPWFSDKADPRVGKILFINNIVAHSGHADQESLEGFNLIMGVADEIAAFKTKEETRSRASPRPGMHSADAIADMMRSSGQSRFPGIGKVIYISYPRFRGDFIEQKYEQSLHEPTMYGTRKATWEVNPTKTREMLDDEFRKDPEGSEAKYACKPPAATNKYFRNDKLIDLAFMLEVREPVDDMGFLMNDFVFSHNKVCAAHMDLATTKDRAGIAIAHMQDWSVRVTADGHELRQPQVFVDLVTSFSAQELGVSELSYEMMEDFLLECRRRGCRLGKATADQYQSTYLLQNLRKVGVDCDRRSVDRDTSAYDVLKLTIYGHRLVAYKRERVITELKGLKLINGIKVDHEPNGSKDEADALAGAVAGVHELAFEALENEISGDRLGWAESESAWHEPNRGAGKWNQTASFAARGTGPHVGRGALRE